MQDRPLAVEVVNESRTLRQELQTINDRFRARHPALRHQDALGFGVFALSCLAIVAVGVAYARGLPALVVIPAAAFFMSLLHEVEHDLIHRLYFKHNKLMYNVMMAGVWLFRPSSINPWTRRDLHLHHHKVSGTDSDLEERAITNGEPWGLRRLLMTFDSMLAILLRQRTMQQMVRAYIAAQKPKTRGEKRALIRQNNLSYMPLGHMHYALWHGFLVYHALAAWAPLLGWQFGAGLVSVMHVVDFLVVVWLGPNVLRSFCLHFVSSNIHYYGDIETRNIVQQTQVWTSAWTLPLQLFCCNFGGTHAIHHFVVQEPFYLRQLTAKESHVVMRKYGVRFDDYGTFTRANRWHEAAVVSEGWAELSAE